MFKDNKCLSKLLCLKKRKKILNLEKGLFFFFYNEECGSKLKLKDLGKSPL